MRDPASLLVAQHMLAIIGKHFDRPVLVFSLTKRFNLCSMHPIGVHGADSATPRCLQCYTTPGHAFGDYPPSVADVLIDRAHALHLHGKGRKERSSRWKSTVAKRMVRTHRPAA